MVGVSSDVLAKPRKALPWLVLVAIFASSPSFRDALEKLLRRLFAKLRGGSFGGFGRPAVRKDFLNGAGFAAAPRSSSSSVARYSAPQKQNWSTSAAAPSQPAARTAAKPAVDGAPTFEQFEHVLPTWLAEALRSDGFHTLKPIQIQILPLALAGRDVCGVAPTGSGKTLAFLIPGIVHTAGQEPPRCAADGPIALILAPTRELAVQINKVAESLLKNSWGESADQGQEAPSSWGRYSPKKSSSGLNSAVIYGGPRRSDQLQTLRFQQCTHIIVATPGRLLDFLENGAFTLKRVSFFVLDEGDRMLDFGFEPDVTEIAKQIQTDRQMLFFSATWPPDVKQAALRLCHGNQSFETVFVEPANAQIEGSDPNAARITIPGHGGVALPPRDIRQVVEVVDRGGAGWHGDDMERKMPLLLQHLEDALGGFGETPGKALIFVGTRVAAEELGDLVARHFGLDRCGVMHGARKQDQREATLQSFRTGRLRALVATDVLGRGVDIPGVTHVVVFDFPGDIETYVHRVGRTGRNGQKGTAITFFEPRPWFPDLARELVDVLKACGQDVPAALQREAGGSTKKSSYDDSWGNGWFSGKAEVPEVPEEGQWKVDESSMWRKAPPLGSDSPGLATAEELGEWSAGGAVWGYSANSGASEQGRFELRSGGLLRTTWGLGEWALLPSAPHCARPSRPCPKAPGTGEAGSGPETANAPEDKAPSAAALLKPGAPHLSLTWGGCCDVVALDATGLGFELVTRSGRAASTYKKKTLGRSLPGVVL